MLLWRDGVKSYLMKGNYTVNALNRLKYSLYCYRRHYITAGTSATTMSNNELDIHFDNKALTALPIDAETKNFPRNVPNACFSFVEPTRILSPRLVAYSSSMLKTLCIDSSLADEAIDASDNDKDARVLKGMEGSFTDYFCGNSIFHGARPAAHCYCGHQFGHFSGQLGDGAAMYMGEIVTSSMERWEMQLKGAGPTPYSRSSDGRKVLRSSLREFLCSEAMHALGIPTTRAATLVVSNITKVERDIHYDGRPRMEPCAVVCRVAPTFLRFGSFEIFKTVDPITGRAGPSSAPDVKLKMLPRMLKYTIETFFPDIWASYEGEKHVAAFVNSSDEDGVKSNIALTAMYRTFFKEVVRRTAVLVARWQCVGFCHGVLNTDNMSIVGVTIDYGPFGFMERYDPEFICNASDTEGRYSYSKQPSMCYWNCCKLAEALDPLLPLDQSMEVVEDFNEIYESEYNSIMRRKLGLIGGDIDNGIVSNLCNDLLTIMAKSGSDFTNTFLALMPVVHDAVTNTSKSVSDVVRGGMDDLLHNVASAKFMAKAATPSVPLERVQELLSYANRDERILLHLGVKRELLERIVDQHSAAVILSDRTECEKRAEDVDLFTPWLTRYVNILRTNVTSSKEITADMLVEYMKETNPHFVLRNHIAQAVIGKAESGDYTEARKILSVLSTPYSDPGSTIPDCYKHPVMNDEIHTVT